MKTKIARAFNRELDLRLEREEGERLLANGVEIDSRSPMRISYKRRRWWRIWEPRLMAQLFVEVSNADWNAGYTIEE